MWTDDETLFLTNNAGYLSTKEIATILKKSYSSVSKTASRFGLSLRTKHHWRQKYPEMVVNEAKRLLKNNLSNRRIGEKTGLPENYVAQLKAGRFRNKSTNNVIANDSATWSLALGRAQPSTSESTTTK